MASTFFGLNIGTSGLYTYQAALNTTSHNISNSETTGYTRQQVSQQASIPLSVKGNYGMVGTGVTATGITQIRSVYYDNKYRSNNSIFGMYSVKETYMAQIETYFNEVENNGLTTHFTSFTNCLQELSKDPSSLSVRTQTVQYAQSFTEYMNTLSSNLKSVQEDCNKEIETTVQRVNSLAEQIAALTKQINTLETASGATANDLRDAREVLVDELSQYANISVTENVVGDSVGRTTYVVKFNGHTLVDTTNYNTLQAVPREDKVNITDADGLYDLVWSNGGEPFNALNATNTGTLKALFQVRDGNNGVALNGTVKEQSVNAEGVTQLKITGTNINSDFDLNIGRQGTIVINNKTYSYDSFTYEVDPDSGEYSYTFDLSGTPNSNLEGQKSTIGEAISYKGIPYYMSQLNTFARKFASEFNKIHSSGVDLNGDAGMDFFTANGEDTIDNYYSITAGNLSINTNIVEDSSKFVTFSSIEDGVAGTDILEKLIACTGDKSMFNAGSPSSFLESLIADVGVDAKKATEFSESQQNILESIKNQRLSVAGVDLDEEAMYLVKFQNAYNLSAKVISVMDEIYDRLINYMGA